DVLHERGYQQATVAPRADLEHVHETAILVFTLEPGVRTTIGSVDVVGRWTASRAELLARLGLRPGAPYEPTAVNTRIERYVEERRAAGYYEAKIVPAVTIDQESRTAHVTLSVTPGPRVHVVFAPHDALSSDRQKELVPVQRE